MRRLTTVAAGSLFAVVAIVAAAAWRSERPRTDAAVTASLGTPAAAATDGLSRPGALATRGTAVRAASASAPTSAGTPATGRIEVIDLDGGAGPAYDGSFVLTLPDGSSQRIRVDHGEFVLAGAWGEGARVDELVLRGQRARFEPDSLAVPAIPGTPLEWKARWIRGGVLRVVDRETGTDLADVAVIAAESPLDAAFASPPERLAESIPVASGSSPLGIPSGAAARTVWVGAPGYAWQREYQLVQDAERTVRLSRGGSLRVRPGGRELWRRVHFVRLYRSHDLVATQSLSSAEDVRLERLPAGAYSLRIEVGAAGKPRAVLAERDVTIAAGAEAVVELQAADWKAEPAAVDVLIRGDLAHDLGSGFRLVATHVQGAAPPFELGSRDFAADGERTLRASILGVQVGDWDFVLEPWGVLAHVRATAGGRESVELLLPTLVRAHVVVRERGTREPIRTRFLSWSRAPMEDGATSACSTAAGPDGSFTLLAAPGPIEAWIVEPGFDPTPQRIDLAPDGGVRELLVDRETNYAVEVSLVDGGARIPLEFDRWTGFQLAPVGHAGRQVRRSFGRMQVGTSLASSRIDLVVNRPGDYHLELADVPGYLHEETQPVLVRVSAEQPTRVALELAPAD